MTQKPIKGRFRDKLRACAQRDDVLGLLISQCIRTVAALLGRPVAMGQFLNYSLWVRQTEPSDQDSVRDEERWAKDHAAPRVTIVMPCHMSRADHLESAVSSVLRQTYANWELVLVEDDRAGSPTAGLIARQVARDPRIRRIAMGNTSGISAATNAGARAGDGPIIAFLDHDDRLHRFALSWVVDAFAESVSTQLVFTDEDKLDPRDRRCEPYLKPGFNRALLYSRNYINHFVAVRREAFERAGGFDPALDGAQDHDLLLKLLDCEGAGAFRHVAKIGYHWRKSASGTSFSASQRQRSWDAGRGALLKHTARASLPVKNVVPTFGGGYRLVFPPIPAPPEISIIVATRDREDLLRRCLSDFLAESDMGGFEIIVVDNGTQDPDTLAWLKGVAALHAGFRVIRDDGAFNYSRLVNRGVAASRGRVVVLLNNDVMEGCSGWLNELAGWASMGWVGCVGAALYYEDGSLQHGGIVLGPGDGAGHYERGASAEQPGMFGHLRLARCASAVTAACMAVRREVFDTVGGFDEKQFPTTYSDVDFCLRVGEAGYGNVWTPYARLTHLEGASRGREGVSNMTAAYKAAAEHFSDRWGHLVCHDPFVNENLDPSSEGVRLRSLRTR